MRKKGKKSMRGRKGRRPGIVRGHVAASRVDSNRLEPGTVVDAKGQVLGYATLEDLQMANRERPTADYPRSDRYWRGAVL